MLAILHTAAVSALIKVWTRPHMGVFGNGFDVVVVVVVVDVVAVDVYRVT